MKKKIILHIICLFVLLLFLISFNKTEYIKSDFISKEQFTQENWNNNPYNRIYIVDDLERKYDISSMNRDEILNLLGKNHCVVSSSHITYTLGRKKEDMFFSYYRIDLDEDGKVIKITKYQD